MIKEFAVISRKNRKKITKFASGGGDGAEVIYSLRNSDTLAKKITNELARSGQNIRKYYQRRLPSDPSKDYYYIMRDTPNNETVIVEYGFADSSGDDVALLKNNWEDLAEAVVRALADYLGVPYVGPVGSNYYVVKSGDTLWGIARKYNTTVDEIKELNNLSSNALSIGQTLLIPGDSSSSADFITYVVKPGDSLWKIANQYNLTVAALKNENNLKTDVLQIGQVLKIPTNLPNVPDENIYTVVAGDSLYRIAQRFNVSVDDLMAYNQLTSTLLSIGQQIRIPSTGRTMVYTVVSGDSLWSIAQRYKTTVQALKTLNNLTSNLLSVGQKLLIPA